MAKSVLLLRFNPYDRDPKAYNVQEIGIGKALCDLGYNFDYVTFKKKNQETITFYENNGCKARWIDKPRFRFLRWGINSEVCSKEFLAKYDVVICREYYQYLTYKATLNHPNVIVYNGPYWNMFMCKPFSPIYDLIFTRKINIRAKKIVSKSNLATEFLKKKGCTNVTTVGVALDTTRFSSDIKPNEDTEKLAEYMSENDCILYIGRIDRNKNYPFLLEVYKQLLQTHPSLKFIVIGKSKQDAIHKLIGKEDSSYEKECISKMPQSVIDGIVRYERIENSQLKFIYPLCKAFLLPSKKEIFGMVMLEAMYLGAPVVTTKNGGSTTLIENKNTGIMIDGFDVNTWVENIDHLLNDEKKRTSFVKAARELVEKEYNWDSIVRKILEDVEE